MICPLIELKSTLAVPFPNDWVRYFSAVVAPGNPRTCMEPTDPFSTVATAVKEDVFGTVNATLEFVELRV